MKRTQYGYELRLVGDAPDVATYGGINVRAVTVWTMALSGAIAGLAGVWKLWAIATASSTISRPALATPESPLRCSDETILTVSASLHSYLAL